MQSELYEKLRKKIEEYSANHLLKPVPKLRRLELEVISACNIRCTYCYLGSQKDQAMRMSYQKARGLIDVAVENEVEKIYLTGGEPLLNSDIIQIIEYASSLHFNEICLVTNGSLIDVDMAKKLSEYPINVAIGIMTHKENSGRILHGNLYDKMKAGVYNLKNAGFSNSGDTHLVAVGTSIMRENCNDVVDFYKWAKENGIVWSGIEPLVCAGDGDISQFPPMDIVKSITNELIQYESVLSDSDIVTPFCSTSGCNTYAGRLYIKADFSVKMCGPGLFELGNLRDMHLKDIWENHPLLVALRHYKELSDGTCSKCQSSCIGCPVTTYNMTGDALNSYPLCWHTKV